MAAIRRKTAIILPALLLGLGIGGWLLWRATTAGASGTRLTASGTIEADQVEVGSQRAARLLEFRVDEGASVATGAIIALLDTSELSAQLLQAEGAAEVAAARLDELRRGTRQEQVRLAGARAEQARATLGGARRTLENARRRYARVTSLRQSLDAAEAERRAAGAAVRQAEAALAGAGTALRTAQEEFDTSIQLRQSRDQAHQQRDSAAAAQRTARAQLDQLLNGTRAEEVSAAEARLSQAQASATAAREDALNATSDLARARTLHQGKALSIQDLDAAVTRSLTAQARLRQAEQATAEARARLEQLRAGARKEEIEAARGALQQAEAQVEGAARLLENAREAYALRLDVRARLESARTQDQVARAELARAQARLTGAEEARRHALTALSDRLEEKQSVDTGRQQYETALGQLEGARAQLDELRNGPTPEEIRQARGQLRQARGALELARVQKAQSVIRAPEGGVVTEHVARVGEVVTPGATLAKLVPLDRVYLTLYVPLPDLGRVRLGQAVEVTTDTYRGKRYHGRVTRISDTPEFTPRNVQTADERVKLVFQVRVDVENPERELKPGMPADAIIRLQ